MSQHSRQEAEANRFAIEVLAPRARFRPYLLRDPDLTAVVELAYALDVSKEATARRYLELSDLPVAMVFHKDRSVRYILKKDWFPRLAIWNNDPLPDINTLIDDSGLTTLDLVNNEDWLEKPMNGELTVQTLVQQDGHGITLLIVDRDEDDDEGDVEDAFDRYSRWG